MTKQEANEMLAALAALVPEPVESVATGLQIRTSPLAGLLRLDLIRDPVNGVTPGVVSAILNVEEAVSLGQGLIDAAAELQAEMDMAASGVEV